MDRGLQRHASYVLDIGVLFWLFCFVLLSLYIVYHSMTCQ